MNSLITLFFRTSTYNAEFTNDEILQAQNEVSKYAGIVNENERIIAKHERVTKDAKLKIDSFRAAKGEKYQDQGISFQLFGKFLAHSFVNNFVNNLLLQFSERKYFR